MNSLKPDASAKPAELAAALDRLWARFLPEIEERLAALESAAAATAAGKLAPEQQQAAQTAAHKLAGILGSFGLADATAPAREIECLYAAESAPAKERGAQLTSLAAALRSLVGSRSVSPPPAQ